MRKLAIYLTLLFVLLYSCFEYRVSLLEARLDQDEQLLQEEAKVLEGMLLMFKERLSIPTSYIQL